MLHGEQFGSCVGVCLWFVSSRHQLSPPLAICSQLQLVSSVVRQGQDFFLLHTFQTGCGTHQASYPLGTEVLSPGVERQGREGDYSPPFSAEVMSPLPYIYIYIHGIGLIN
jgi:hypothetical protein